MNETETETALKRRIRELELQLMDAQEGMERLKNLYEGYARDISKLSDYLMKIRSGVLFTTQNPQESIVDVAIRTIEELREEGKAPLPPRQAGGCDPACWCHTSELELQRTHRLALDARATGSYPPPTGTPDKK